MEYVELVASTSACIETVAKGEFRRATETYFKQGGSQELSDKIEILGRFLESADFKKLWSESEVHLLGGKKVTFRLFPSKDKPEYEMIID